MEDIDRQLQQIAQHYMLHGSFLSDLGLFNGKMGVVIFFFHYARFTDDILYDEFASELLNEVIEDVHDRLPFCLSDGLCGIGWGVFYLIRNKFIEGDAEEVLCDIDRQIMEYAPHRIKDSSLEYGLEGLACYIFSRLNEEGLFGLYNHIDIEYVQNLQKTCLCKLNSQRPIISLNTKEICTIILDRLFMNLMDSECDCLSWKSGLKKILSNETCIFDRK